MVLRGTCAEGLMVSAEAMVERWWWEDRVFSEGEVSV